jgi:hypothetical protein
MSHPDNCNCEWCGANPDNPPYCENCEKLQADNERLKEALVHAYHYANPKKEPMCSNKRLLEIIEQALERTEQ